MPTKIVLTLSALLFLAAAPALADDGHKGYGGGKSQWQEKHHYKHGKHHHGKHHYGKHDHGKHGHGSYSYHSAPPPAWYGGHGWQPQYHRPAVKSRKHDHGHGHGHGYGHGKGYDKPVSRKHDSDWAIYAILALQIVEVLNDNQRQYHYAAQHRAVTAPLGNSIRWNDGGAGGSVIVTREGSDGAGRYCREFQQEIYVGNQRQSGYGIACRQPDGAWEIGS